MEVEVYRNLHKNVWSVRDKRTGRVIDHQERVVIRNARFVVQPAGRAKVLREQRKNVHAFARGLLVPEQGYYSDFLVDAEEYADADSLMYNPYKMDTFKTVGTGKPVHESEKAYLDKRAGRPRVHAVRCTP